MAEMRRDENAYKEYVKVRADFCLDGSVVPLKFRAEEGETMLIDRIVDVRQAPALKAGGQGTRYTCRVGERMIYLFHDRDRWFVERTES